VRAAGFSITPAACAYSKSAASSSRCRPTTAILTSPLKVDGPRAALDDALRDADDPTRSGEQRKLQPEEGGAHHLHQQPPRSVSQYQEGAKPL
jgi:hypothetical protein